MRELGHRLGLSLQACGGDRIGLAAQQLDRNLAIELRIISAIDDTHPAFAEHLDDEIATDAAELVRVLGSELDMRPEHIASVEI